MIFTSYPKWFCRWQCQFDWCTNPIAVRLQLRHRWEHWNIWHKYFIELFAIGQFIIKFIRAVLLKIRENKIHQMVHIHYYSGRIFLNIYPVWNGVVRIKTHINFRYLLRINIGTQFLYFHFISIASYICFSIGVIENIHSQLWTQWWILPPFSCRWILRIYQFL